jgi:hypothetical protein
MTTVYYSWFGSPAKEVKRPGGNESVRPDIFGPEALAKANFSSGTEPTLNFCCPGLHAKQYESLFFGLLASGSIKRKIQVVNIDDQLADSSSQTLGLSEVFRGMTKADLPGAFMKDIWSLYCVWKFGGYHLDGGCGPFTRDQAVSLPEPKFFGTVALEERPNYPYQHRLLENTDGRGARTCALLSKDITTAGAALLHFWKSDLADSSTKEGHLIDVWMLRSPAKDPVAGAALEFYVKGWRAIQKAKVPPKLVPDLLRDLIVSSVATAITHTSSFGAGSEPQNPCRASFAAASHHMIAATRVPAAVEAFNIGKVGFQSHQTNNT